MLNSRYKNNNPFGERHDVRAQHGHRKPMEGSARHW